MRNVKQDIRFLKEEGEESSAHVIQGVMQGKLARKEIYEMVISAEPLPKGAMDCYNLLRKRLGSGLGRYRFLNMANPLL